MNSDFGSQHFLLRSAGTLLKSDFLNHRFSTHRSKNWSRLYWARLYYIPSKSSFNYRYLNIVVFISNNFKYNIPSTFFMNAKEFLKPSILKISIFLFIGVFYLYFAKESTCAAGFSFAFCYIEHGFPFSYIISGDIDAASGYLKTLFFGKFFFKSGNFLFNYAALLLDIIFIYLLSCFISRFFKI